MIIKSKAPLRIGLSGGGTDIENFSKKYGGLVINSAINLYVHTIIDVKKNDKIIFETLDSNKKIILKSSQFLELNGNFDIFKSIYNYFAKECEYFLEDYYKDYIKLSPKDKLDKYIDRNANIIYNI